MQTQEVALFTFEFSPGSDDVEDFEGVINSEEWVSGLFPGQPLIFVAFDNEKKFTSLQCPISHINEVGKIQFAIRLFKQHKMGENPEYFNEFA